jgi:hypothetical protein
MYKRRDNSVKTGKEKIVGAGKNMNILGQQNVTGIKHIMTERQRKGEYEYEVLRKCNV